MTLRCSPEELGIIARIAERSEALYRQYGSDVPAFVIARALVTCHGGVRLNLLGLLNSSDLDLGHDITGIRFNLDWDTGMFRVPFRPCCNRIDGY